MASEKQTKSEGTSQYFFLGATLGMGWQLAVSVLVPIFVGHLLDEKFHTGILCTAVGFILATVSSILVVRRSMRLLNTKMEEFLNKDNSKPA